MNSLWDNLGGNDTIRAIVNDFVDLAVADPNVNYSRNGRYVTDAKMLARTKQAAFEFLSGAIGGPYPYEGRGLKEIHDGMGITDSEFTAIAADFRVALERNRIPPDVIAIASKMIEAVRPLIVDVTSA